MGGLRIKDEDLMMLNYVFQSPSGYLTFDMMHKYLYPDLSKKGFESKMRRFEKERLIHKIYLKIFDGERATRVAAGSKKGIKILEGYRYKIQKMKKRNGTELEYIDPMFYKEKRTANFLDTTHDNVLNELRFELEKIGCSNFIEGNILYRKHFKDDIYQNKPDYVFKVGKYTFALEYEHSPKAKNRYKDILETYFKETQVDYVIYITPSQVLFDYVKRAMNPENIPEKYGNKFWVSSLDHFLIKKDFIIYNNLNKPPFDIDNLRSLLE